MRCCLIASYPPRACGIATFTSDLRAALMSLPEGLKVDVVAVTNQPNQYDYPGEVVFEVQNDDRDDYRRAAEFINNGGYDVVCVQHEFGIFGGPDGRYINLLLERLRPPVVATLHTVLEEPPTGIRNSMIGTAAAADHLVVLANSAVPILRQSYDIDLSQVSVIPHGVPDVDLIDTAGAKAALGAENRTLLLTFGLLSSNKGIEVVIDALPRVVAEHPDVLYIVLGATHPEVKRREGEAYRQSLQDRVERLGLQDHVLFDDRYVELSELCRYIAACDIYVTPYLSRDQIVSGTLAYAVGMGKAVVSTPYVYAEELLAHGRGRLVDFGDAEGFSQALHALISDPVERERTRAAAYEFGRDMTWARVAERYRQLFVELGSRQASTSVVRTLGTRPRADLAEINLAHLSLLTDQTSVLQHATHGVPDRRYGYTTDDASRALLAAMRFHGRFGDAESMRIAMTCLSFLQFAQGADGQFRNVMSYDRRFLDEGGSQDTLGQTLWALGMASQEAPTPGMALLADHMFLLALPHVDALHHPRALAYALSGLAGHLEAHPDADDARTALESVVEKLLAVYCDNPEDRWKWFGDDLTYGNAKVPHALLLASQVTQNEAWGKIALEALEFVLHETYHDGYFDFVGNEGWYHRGGDRRIFGQQPIEAGYSAEACMLAYEVTGEARFQEMARAAAEWFVGRNRLGAVLYDSTTGACSDGLDRHGASTNQGAESVICCLLGLLAVTQPTMAKVKVDLRPGAGGSSGTASSLQRVGQLHAGDADARVGHSVVQVEAVPAG